MAISSTKNENYSFLISLPAMTRQHATLILRPLETGKEGVWWWLQTALTVRTWCACAGLSLSTLPSQHNGPRQCSTISERIKLYFTCSLSKLRDEPEGNSSAELHLAESIKGQLQQLKTSVNAANQFRLIQHYEEGIQQLQSLAVLWA